MPFELEKREYQSPRWSYEIVDCSMPMSIDTYSNCGYQCAYCFSQYQRSTNQTRGSKYKERKLVQAISPERIKRMFTGEIQMSKKSKLGPESGGYWQFNKYIEQRKMMQWGGLSDPFCSIERELGVGLEVMRFLRSIDYPISFSTKGTWFLDDERYMELFRNNPNWHVKFSIITGDKKKAAFIEKGVRSPAERLRAIERLANVMPRKGAVTLRLRPFIIGVSNPSHKELIKSAADAGAGSVSTEFFCMEGRLSDKSVYDVISNQCGFDIYNFYRRHTKGAGYLRLNREIKRQYIDEMEDAARSAGIGFYVSDAHFKERSDSGCCCGMDNTWPWSRGQLCQALQVAKNTGVVTWDDISDGLEFAEIFGHRHAQGYNTKCEENVAKYMRKSMKEFLRCNWNSTTGANGPYRFFGGVLTPAERDEKGNLVYKFNKEKI